MSLMVLPGILFVKRSTGQGNYSKHRSPRVTRTIFKFTGNSEVARGLTGATTRT